jgi:hypothetical protein
MASIFSALCQTEPSPRNQISPRHSLQFCRCICMMYAIWAWPNRCFPGNALRLSTLRGIVSRRRSVYRPQLASSSLIWIQGTG